MPGGSGHNRQLAAERLVLGGEGACSGRDWLFCGHLWSTRPRFPQGLFAPREEKATEGLCQLQCGHGGLLGSGQIPGHSSTGRYCTEQEEVPVREGGDWPALVFCPFFHTPEIPGVSWEWPPQRAGLRGAPGGFATSTSSPFTAATVPQDSQLPACQPARAHPEKQPLPFQLRRAVLAWPLAGLQFWGSWSGCRPPRQPPHGEQAFRTGLGHILETAHAGV